VEAGVAAVEAKDRVGIGWRGELAAGILTNLDRIDVLEVIADDFFEAPAKDVRALRTLSAQRPVMLHGVGMGLASTVRVETKRLETMARLLNAVRPESWSEHLAFVRGGGIEIGHLAQPPRNRATVEATAANIQEARRVCGTTPAMENIATLFDPPGSSMGDAEWLSSVIRESGAGLLLDLHNVATNAVNLSQSPWRYRADQCLDALPLEGVRLVHIAGGRFLSEGRLLDDHKHPVPRNVFEMLTEVARRAAGPLTVVLERDGAYPEMDELLNELDSARLAIEKGRARKLLG
jgi:hypothetical protein